jgi:hypothetical protein
MGTKSSKDKKTDGDDRIVGDNLFSPPPGNLSSGDAEQGVPDLALPGANGNSADALSSGAGLVDGTTSSRRKKTNLSRVREKLRFVQDFQAYLKPTRQSFYAYCRAILYLIVPATGIAFILFYLVENPPTVSCEKSCKNIQRDHSRIHGTYLRCLRRAGRTPDFF